MMSSPFSSSTSATSLQTKDATTTTHISDTHHPYSKTTKTSFDKLEHCCVTFLHPKSKSSPYGVAAVLPAQFTRCFTILTFLMTIVVNTTTADIIPARATQGVVTMSSTASRHRAAFSIVSDETNNRSCAVVGVGVLGTSLCKQLLSSRDFKGYRKVFGITRTNDRHEQIWEQIGSSSVLQLVTAEEVLDKSPATRQKCDDVIFCAPPSGFENYPNALHEAITSYWKGPTSGVFVFTSSGAV
jgi:hypothetical protein